MVEFGPADVVAVISEGSAEKCIMELLLSQGLLKFSSRQLLDDKVLDNRYFRDHERFELDYLGMNYQPAHLILIIIQDRKIDYRITRAFAAKIHAKLIVVTAPEIEMLMIHASGLYNKYKNKKDKPSHFLSQNMKISTKEIKSKKYVEKFFQDHDLIQAILDHRSKCKREEKYHFLADLLRDEG